MVKTLGVVIVELLDIIVEFHSDILKVLIKLLVVVLIVGKLIEYMLRPL